MKEKRPGTNIMTLIFVSVYLINERTKYYMTVIFLPGFLINERKATLNKYYGQNNNFVPNTIHHYLKLRQTETNIMVIIFVPGSLINESYENRNEYDGHYICSGYNLSLI